MTFTKNIFIFILILLFIGCGKSNQNLAKMQSIVDSKWTTYTQSNMAGNGSIAIYITSPKGNYFLKSGNTSAYMTQHAHFRAASTTKTFTAAAIMLLAQQGKLDIDDKLTNLIPNSTKPYLPNTPYYNIPYKSSITIKQLLQHRAGVFDVANDKVPTSSSQPYAGYIYEHYIREILGDELYQFSLEEIISIVATNELFTNAPGIKFAYSDTGYSILGKIIERVSSKSYSNFINDNFFSPFALDNSSMPHLSSTTMMPTPYINGDLWADGKLYKGSTNEIPSTYNNVSARVAEGNIVSTLDNLARWVKGWLRGEMGLDSTTVSLMKDVIATGEGHEWYGLGTVYTAGLGYGHNGAILGYGTIMRYDPETDVTVVANMNILNADDFVSQFLIAYEILRDIKKVIE